MNIPTKRLVQRFLLKIVVATSLFLFLDSCSGGSKSQPDTVVNPEDLPTGYNDITPEDIYNYPVIFDKQGIEEIDQLIQTGRILTPIDKANILVNTEAAINHLNNILENLVGNDDNADTWNVINELYDMNWLAQTSSIISVLQKMDLDDLEFDRLTTINAGVKHSKELMKQLTQRIPQLPDPTKNL